LCVSCNSFAAAAVVTWATQRLYVWPWTAPGQWVSDKALNCWATTTVAKSDKE